MFHQIIQTRDDLRRWLAADLERRGLARWGLRERLTQDCLAFQRLLRFTEYRRNNARGPFGGVLAKLATLRLQRAGIRFGFTIPPNVFGPGLLIPHWGTIAVNAKARVGANCTICQGVTIGEFRGKAPTIGDDVYIGPNAVLYGGCTIGDRAVIGANAVVGRDVPAGVTVAGAPARIISRRDVSQFQSISIRSHGAADCGANRANVSPVPPL